MPETTRNRPATAREAVPEMSVRDAMEITGLEALDEALNQVDGSNGRRVGDGGRAIRSRTKWTAIDLLAADFPPLIYAVEGLVPEGLSLLVGAPKVGKSWAALDLGLAVASGRPALGGVAVDKGDVLYLALEDGPRRLRDRLRMRLQGAPAPERLQFATQAPAINEGLHDVLDDWYAEVSTPRLVVLDVFAKIKPPSDGRRSAYAEDYGALAPLQQWATENRVAVVVVHHTRKAKDDDYLAAVSGTHGLAGAADAVLVLSRTRTSTNAVLSVTGRDIIEREVSLNFDGAAGLWQVAGGSLGSAAVDAHANRVTDGVGDRMAEVITCVVQAEGDVSAVEVGSTVGISADHAGRYLRRAAEAGRIERAGRGLYRAPLGALSEVSEVSARCVQAVGIPDTEDTSDMPMLGLQACEGCGADADRTSSVGTPWCSGCWDEAARGATACK